MKKNESKIRAMTLRRRLKKHLKAKGIFIVNGRKLHLCKTKELATEAGEIYHPISKEASIYFIGNTQLKICKIGYSANVAERMKGIQTGCPYPLTILGLIAGNKDDEMDYHDRFRNHKMSGEWFSIEGSLSHYLKL